MRQILFLFAIMACIAYQSTKVSAKVNTLEQIQNLTNESLIGFLVIENSPQFRNIDINFGRGYKNRGFSKIVF